MKYERDKVQQVADPELLERLDNAGDDDELTIIVQVNDDDEDELEPIAPDAFEDFRAYRNALKQRQQNRMQRVTGPVLQELQGFDVQVKGGQMANNIVIKGKAGPVARTLEIPRIRQATLDKDIFLEEITVQNNVEPEPQEGCE